MIVKHYAPWSFLLSQKSCTTRLGNSQISCTTVWYEEEIHFGKLLHKQSEMVFEYLRMVTLTFDTVTTKSIGFQCYPGLMCGPCMMRKVGQDVLELLIGNSFGIFDPSINGVNLLPRMDVWTKFEVGRSRRF